MASCEHQDFEAKVIVNRIEHNTKGLVFMADIHVRCAHSGTRFRFKGAQAGVSFSEPMSDVSGFELRAPIEPDAHLTSLMAMHPDSTFPATPREEIGNEPV